MERKFSDQELIRRTHLQELKNQNKNPFLITKVDRSMFLKDFAEKYKNFSKEELHNMDLEKLTLAGRFNRNTSNLWDYSRFFSKVTNLY